MMKHSVYIFYLVYLVARVCGAASEDYNPLEQDDSRTDSSGQTPSSIQDDIDTLDADADDDTADVPSYKQDAVTSNMTSRFPSLQDQQSDEANDFIKKTLEDNPGINVGINIILIAVVVQTMLGLGCTLDIDLIREHLMQPTG